MASHNNVGAAAAIAQADEVDADGDLLPDIAEDSPLRTIYHRNLVDDGLPARSEPLDQTGDRYTNCEAYGDGTQYADDAAYAQALRSGNACYIGYLDAQWELVFSIFPLSWNADVLYPANPGDPEDGHQDDQDAYCRGEDDTEETTGTAADVVLTRAQRAVNGYTADTQCDGFNHQWSTLADVYVDSDLLEPASQAGAVTGDSATTISEQGSGYNTLPLLGLPYTFLFGQPHPDSEDTTGVTATEVNDLTGGLTFPTNNPCGDRTKVCELLSPDDVRNFDHNADALGLEPGHDQQARVCYFMPQFSTVGGGDNRDAGMCGNFGNLYNIFRGHSTAGGFGLDTETGGAPTFVNTAPGWYSFTVLITGEYDRALDAAFAADGVGGVDNGVFQYTAVNPKTPGGNDEVWCIRPNFVTHSDSDVALPTGIDDPGVYGTYVADGIDVDIRPASLQNQYEAVVDNRELVWEGPAEVPGGAPDDVEGIPVDNDSDDRIGGNDTLDTVNFLADEGLTVVGDATSGLGLPSEVTDALNETIDTTNDVINRANYLEGASTDDDVATPDTDDERSYTLTLEEGFQCDFTGSLSLRAEETNLDGAVVFDTNVLANTVWLKDPTVLEDFEGIPAPANASNTERNGWQVDLFDFNGNILTVTDTNQNGQFDDCATPSGQPQPDNDLCGWRAIWDAYNDDCADFADTPCPELLDSFGYDRDAGVGLYSVITVKGPVVVQDQGAPVDTAFEVYGDNNINAVNCIVGTSTGFAPKLANHLGVSEAEITDELCPEDADGDQVLYDDAFSNQDGVNPGSFSSNVRFAKLMPTPDALDSAESSESFSVCVNGIWNVLTDTTDENYPVDGVAGDTKETIRLTGFNTFGDCDTFDDAVDGSGGV